jgi:Arc/MetJ family transcription regulator
MHRLVVSLMQIKEQSMRTTVTIDDTLLAQAQALSGIRENGPLLKTALQALIQRESALRLARLGGSQPDLKDVPRRRSAEN